MQPELWQTYPLLSTMAKLRASRFNAAERLGRRYRWHSLSLVVLSVYVIALSIAPQFFDIGSDQRSSVLSFVAIVSSVFVVALSVYSAFSEDVVRGKYLHDNAKRVTNLYHRYKIAALESEKSKSYQLETAEFEREYANIMDSCPYNHDTLDFRSAMNEINGVRGFGWFSTKFSSFLDTYMWPFLAIFIPPLALYFGLNVVP